MGDNIPHRNQKEVHEHFEKNKHRVKYTSTKEFEAVVVVETETENAEKGPRTLAMERKMYPQATEARDKPSDWLTLLLRNRVPTKVGETTVAIMTAMEKSCRRPSRGTTKETDRTETMSHNPLLRPHTNAQYILDFQWMTVEVVHQTHACWEPDVEEDASSSQEVAVEIPQIASIPRKVLKKTPSQAPLLVPSNDHARQGPTKGGEFLVCTA